MDSTRRTQLIRQRAVAKASFTRMQTFIETGGRKLNDTQDRFDELPNMFNKFEGAQSELELLDDTDHSVDRQQFEDQYFEVKAKFNEILHPVVNQIQLGRAQLVAVCQGTAISHHVHIQLAHT